jgi:hypothetical protein
MGKGNETAKDLSSFSPLLSPCDTGTIAHVLLLGDCFRFPVAVEEEGTVGPTCRLHSLDWGRL